jgi:hypothetical protein
MREQMKYTIRRFGLAVVTLPLASLAYGAVYFGLALLANSYASVGLFLSNLVALGFGWIVAITFAKQIMNLIERIANNGN